MKQAWLSDLHIGVRDHPSDDFGGYEREKQFFQTLKQLNTEVDLIGLNGDIFELWGFEWEEIKESRNIILDAISRYVDVFIKGNHDSDLPKIIGNVLVEDHYSLRSAIYVSHGHTYDKLNFGEFGFVGEWGARLGSLVEEYVYKDIDLLWYKLQNWADDGRYGRNKEYFKQIKEDYSSYEIEIIGHTHDKYTSEFQKDMPLVFNTGTWINGQSDVIILDYSKTNIKVTSYL